MTHFREVFLEHDLTEQQWRVLRTLYAHSPLEISELAKQSCILLPSMTGILNRLESRQLITRQTNYKDQRSKLIELSQEARALIQASVPQMEERYRLIEEQYGRERLAQLCQELNALEGLLAD